MSIPQSRVVGADVSDDGEVVHEGSKHYFVEGVCICHSLAISGCRKIIVEGGELPKAHDFTNHPYRWTACCSGAMGAEKILSAPSDFGVDLGKGLCVPSSVAMDFDIFIGLRTMSMSYLVSSACAEGDFATLNGVEYEHAQVVIEAIDFPKVLKISSGNEIVASRFEKRMSVAGKAEVICMAEVV